MSLNLFDGYVLPGLLERFQTLDGIVAHLTNYPTAIHQPPTMIHVAQPAPAPRQSGQVIAYRFITLHRLHLKWQAQMEAEAELRTYQDAITTLIDADPTLGGRIVHGGCGGVCGGGQARLTGLAPGFVDVGGVTYRVLDATTEVLIKVGVSHIRTI